MQKKQRPQYITTTIILVIFAVVTLFPFYFMIISSFKNNAGIAANPFSIIFPLITDNYVTSFATILHYFRNSIIITGCTVIITSFISILSAYIFARYDFPGKNIIYMFVLSFMMIPTVLTLIPKYVLVSDMKLIGTYWSAILPVVSVSQISFIVVLRPYIEAIPKDIIDAARMDGAGGIRVFFFVVAPLIKPTLIAQMLLCFLNSWNDFIWPMLTLSSNKELKTITLGLYSYSDAQQVLYGPMFAGFVMATLPMVVLFALNMKNFIRGLTDGAVKM